MAVLEDERLSKGGAGKSVKWGIFKLPLLNWFISWFLCLWREKKRLPGIIFGGFRTETEAVEEGGSIAVSERVKGIIGAHLSSDLCQLVCVLQGEKGTEEEKIECLTPFGSRITVEKARNERNLQGIVVPDWIK